MSHGSTPLIVGRDAEPRIFNGALDRFALELNTSREALAADLHLDVEAADLASADRLRSAMERYISHTPPEQRRIVAGDLGPVLGELDARLKSGWNDCAPICEPHGAPGRKST